MMISFPLPTQAFSQLTLCSISKSAIPRSEYHRELRVSAQILHMKRLTRRGVEALVTGLAALLFLSSFLSPFSDRLRRSFSTSGASLQASDVPDEKWEMVVVYITVPDKESGHKLAESIISSKLAACVNQIPGVDSTYWWNGKVETSSEALLIVKTRHALVNDLTKHVKANHPYEVPEVISFPITGGNSEYLQWIQQSTKALDR